MTALPHPSTAPAGDDDVAEVRDTGTDTTDDGSQPPAARRPRRGRKGPTIVMSVITLAALCGFGYLGWTGVDAARNVVGGTAQEVITDSNAPGFVAVVEETRVSMVAVTRDDGRLDSVLIFPDASSDGASTSVTWILGELLIPTTPGEPETSLRNIFADEGIEALTGAVTDVLGFGVTDAIIATQEDLVRVAEFVAPVRVSNPTPVRVLTEPEGGFDVRFETGVLELDAARLAEFITVESAHDPAENRGLRAEIGLAALASELAELIRSNPELEAPETPADLGGFLIRWGLGDHRFITLPLVPIAYKEAFLYRPDHERIALEVAPEVPFPVSAYPGQRPRTRLLNGTPDTSRASTIAPQVASLGAEVSTIGNANALDVAATSVVYSDESFAEVADRIAAYLGTTAEKTDHLDAADIDVVLGADFDLDL